MIDDAALSKIRRMIELARGHVESGGFNAAGAYYRMILKDTSPPKNGIERLAHGEACIWYARRSIADGKIGAAADWYQRALIADPLAADYRIEYCERALLPMGSFKNARIEAERATKVDPVNKKAWAMLGKVEHVLGNIEASVAAHEQQLALDGDDPIARLDRATIALDTADYDTVREMCAPVLSTARRADALHCLAMVAYRESRHEDAIDLYDQAIAAGCYDQELATWNKSLALHSIGRYREGWAAHEARGRQKTDEPMALLMRRFMVPILDLKKHSAPARVHIHQEMGHGDVIAMARYIPALIEEGYDVRLEVMESMVSLMQRSFPDCNVMPKAVDYPGAMGIPPFDYHVPMLSLPAIFETSLVTVPWFWSYMKADPDLADSYRTELPETGRKIGLCWSSGIRQDGLWISEYGRRKSMKFDALLPLLDGDGCFVSLQVGPERKDKDWRMLDLLPAKPSWDDTAALISCLDLVITVDTSVAHLAGAMGKPTWVMMQKDGSSWHWMCERPGASWNTASPWYPSARVFRQREFNRPHHWDGVVDDVRDALSKQLAHAA